MVKTDKTRIEKGLYWDEAWSLVSGCTPVSEGCQNCWSARETHMRAKNPNEKVRARNQGLTEAGQFNGRVRLNYEFLEKPLRKKKPTVYAVWNDLFHEDVPDEFIKKVFDVIATVSRHTFIVLTKRPRRLLEFVKWQTHETGEGYLNEGNVWLGVTAENQARADERIPILLQIPAAVRFISVEPMLGPVDLSKWLGGTWYCETCECTVDPEFVPFSEIHYPCENYLDFIPGIDWVICGGESGRGARPMHPDWVRSLRDQCQAAGVPFFFKQWGEWEPVEQVEHGLLYDDEHRLSSHMVIDLKGEDWTGAGGYGFIKPGWHFERVGKKNAGRILDGRTWDEMPEI